MLDVLIEPNAAALVDGISLVAALENIELVPYEFFVSHYYETLEHQLSTIYQQFILVYEDCRHEESAPQVRAMERAFKKSSEGELADPREERRWLSTKKRRRLHERRGRFGFRSRGGDAEGAQIH